MAAVEVPHTLEYKGGQLNAAPILELETFTNWKKRFMCHIIDDQMNSIINCLTAKSTWDDLILYHEGPSDVKESRVMDLTLCYNTFKLKEDSELASLFGKLKYEENLIDIIYETEKSKSLISATPLSTAFFSAFIIQEFQDSTNDEEDTRSSSEYLNDLEEEYQARALLAKSKRFFKKVPSYQSPFQPKLLYLSEHKPEPRHTKDFEAKYNKVKAKLARLSSSASTPSSSSGKNKSLIAEMYDWDKEEVSSYDNEVTKVKVLMELTNKVRVSIGKESANNGKWVKISIQKVHTLLEIEDSDDRKSFLDYLCIDLNYVEEQRNNLLSKHRNLVHELNTCKEQLLKKILGIDQFTEDTSSSGPKDPVFVKSSADNSEVSITGNKPKLSGAKDFTLSNHDTVTYYDSADESSVCSTSLPPQEKPTGAKPISGPKTIKSILKSKFTFKAETLKGIIINEPSSAPARGNKSSSASKTNSAPASKLKNVKIEDDPPLAIVMKELNELK
ncbi:hypothetical protein Tco_1376791 [Tanacetum coccineum]